MTAIALHTYRLGCVLPGDVCVFHDINASFGIARHALVGRNGSGKTLLARMLAGTLRPTQGEVVRHVDIAYLPQHDTEDAPSIAQALGLQQRLDALRRIELGSTDAEDFHTLADDWQVRERLSQWLQQAGVADDASRPWQSLSGGERVRLRLARMFALSRHFLILDEPGNHLDRGGRERLREQLHAHAGGYVLVCHDRGLLATAEHIHELSALGLRRHHGSYQSWTAQRERLAQAAEQQLAQARREQQALQRRQQAQRERLLQRQQEAGRERAEANMPTILLDRKKQRSQDSGARLRTAQLAQQARQSERLAQARERVEQAQRQRFDLGEWPATRAPLVLEGVLTPYAEGEPIDLMLAPGERLHLSGDNGSGKSSLLAVIAGQLPARAGRIRRGARVMLIDQHYRLLRPDASALENLSALSPGHAPARYREYLAGIGLRGAAAEACTATLSGGERVKLALLALDSAREPYDLLLLDEPDSHLDLDSRQWLEQALASYRGSLILVSHDADLVARSGIERELRLHKTLALPARRKRQ